MFSSSLETFEKAMLIALFKYAILKTLKWHYLMTLLMTCKLYYGLVSMLQVMFIINFLCPK